MQICKRRILASCQVHFKSDMNPLKNSFLVYLIEYEINLQHKHKSFIFIKSLQVKSISLHLSISAQVSIYFYVVESNVKLIFYTDEIQNKILKNSLLNMKLFFLRVFESNMKLIIQIYINIHIYTKIYRVKRFISNIHEPLKNH